MKENYEAANYEATPGPASTPPPDRKDASGAQALSGYYARYNELTRLIAAVSHESAAAPEVSFNSEGVHHLIRLTDHKALVTAARDALTKERDDIAAKIKALGFELPES